MYFYMLSKDRVGSPSYYLLHALVAQLRALSQNVLRSDLTPMH